MSFMPLDLSEILIHGDVSMTEAIYGEEEDEDRIEFTPFVHSDDYDDRPPSVDVGLKNENELELDWPDYLSEDIEENTNSECALDCDAPPWKYEDMLSIDDMDESVVVMDEREIELNPLPVTMYDFDPNSRFETLYDYDPNSRFEGINYLDGDTQNMEGEFQGLLGDVLTISPSLEVSGEEDLASYLTFSPSFDYSTTLSSTSLNTFPTTTSSPFNDYPISPPVSISSNPFIPAVCTVSSPSLLECSASSSSSSTFLSPYSPTPLNNYPISSFSSLDPISSVDSYSCFDHSILTDPPPSFPFDTSTIPTWNGSPISNPTTWTSHSFSVPLSSPSSSSTSVLITNQSAPMEMDSIRHIPASMPIGTFLKSVNAVSGIKDSNSRRNTRKENVSNLTLLDKVVIDPRLAEIFDLEMVESDCTTENDRLLYCALLRNAKNPSRSNIDAKLAIKKILREELRPSQAAFRFGLNIKNFMRQYHFCMAAADEERRKMVNMESRDGKLMGNIKMETNRRKKNRVLRQVYSTEEEIIDRMDDSALLNRIFSNVFGDLFEGWETRRGIRETILTLSTAISKGIRPSNRHVPRVDEGPNLNIENDIIPFYRKIVEEFKKIPELSQFVKTKKVVISEPRKQKE